MTLAQYLFRQVTGRNFYLFFLATLTMTLMHAWRGYLRDQIFWNKP